MPKHKLQLPEQYIVFDLEYTSWEGTRERNWSGAHEHREIIQIGAVKVHGLTEVDTFLMYVRPRINPTLSDYIINLTGISQEDVDAKGQLYAQAQQEFHVWCESLPMYSIHGCDGEVLRENAVLNNLSFPFPETQFKSAETVFGQVGVDVSGYMSSTVVTAFGGVPLPNAHDALSDARSILRAFQLAAETER